MFKKTSNMDLLNKLNSLENKVDVILYKLNKETYMGCCDCKNKETQIYNELKLYIEDKIEELKSQFINKLDEINVSTNNFNELFYNYKTELVNNLDTIINQIYSSNESKVSKNTGDYTTLIDNLSSKIDTIFYENEVIKHQFLLEDEIRKYNDEILNLKTEIKTVLNDINTILGKQN